MTQFSKCQIAAHEAGHAIAQSMYGYNVERVELHVDDETGKWHGTAKRSGPTSVDLKLPFFFGQDQAEIEKQLRAALTPLANDCAIHAAGCLSQLIEGDESPGSVVRISENQDQAALIDWFLDDQPVWEKPDLSVFFRYSDGNERELTIAAEAFSSGDQRSLLNNYRRLEQRHYDPAQLDLFKVLCFEAICSVTARICNSQGTDAKRRIVQHFEHSEASSLELSGQELSDILGGISPSAT